ncbi:MAG: hypothetical protein HC913_01660 [Microscillaceae bacterium]|nr:hypothetical protein [Microscillaceae bacterium]
MNGQIQERTCGAAHFFAGTNEIFKSILESGGSIESKGENDIFSLSCL